MKRIKPKSHSHSYSADRPIQSKREDLLGRAQFATSLANDIQGWEGNDSLVIALYGAWGSGKTSVKNILLERLRMKRTNPLHLVEFNPWQLSGTGGIASSFFRELGIALRKPGPTGDAEKRAKTWNAYSSLLVLSGTAIKSIGSLLAFSGEDKTLAVVAAGEGMKALGAASKEGSEALKAKGESEVKSLHELKCALATMLTKLPQPVLVIIDDIDRLTTDEILQVFQLVKANADFPKVIYLLVFERSVVAKALDNVSDGRGSEFLEKIVQVGFHIPHASRRAVHKLLCNRLEALLPSEWVIWRGFQES